MECSIEKRLKELRELLENFHSMIESDEKCEDHKNCCEQEKNDDDDEGCEILEELDQEYRVIVEWCFGVNEKVVWSKSKTRKVWKRLHPNLPLPRILESEGKTGPLQMIIGLLIDAYPMYLAEKKKCYGFN